MASIARDNLYIIRISRKVILSELTKKLGGSEPQYECWFQDGRYWSVVRTAIATREENTSSKLEQAMGPLDSTKEGAEEKAATTLIEVLKRTYGFEVDDINLAKRAEAEHENEQLLKQMDLCASVQNRQSERIRQLSKYANEVLNDMDFLQGTCNEICGSALVALRDNEKTSALTDIMYSLHYLDDWAGQKVFEHTVRLR